MKSWFGIAAVVLAFSAASAADRAAAPEKPGAPREHWSFVAPKRAPLPAVARTRWVRNPIDAFVLARLEKARIKPSPEADRIALIRRLSFDLTGLPPKLEEVRSFLEDRQPEAYERLVDRLLLSPHYGEQWGRHWLDLARYADSDGYEKDSVRPYAYLYRDWVINALNRDLPFDEFTVEQLAGDLLPGAGDESKIATGFHRQTLTNKEGGVDPEEFRCKAVVDRVNTTAAVWLGLTLACAECHNHKYDPISQREYYQFYAFFNNAAEKDLPLPRADELARYEEAKRRWTEEHARLRADLDLHLGKWEANARASLLTNAALVESERSSAGSTNALPEPVQKALALPAEQRGERERAELMKYFLEYAGPEARKLDERLAAHAKKEPKYPETKAAILADDDKPRETRIHVRGDFLRQGDAVQPGTLEVLHPFAPRRRAPPDRLDLARWLVHPANPLTARVTVNRVWRHLFGRGLVTTMDDFGTRGEPPSHPELLDWLAVTFQSSATNPSSPGLAWSQKELIRLIVTSSTYRQASRYRPDLAERDPGNVWLARQNRFRLEAENVRDAYLTVSGLLNPALGGRSVRPPLPADIAAIGYADSIKWKESQGADKYRRGLYIFFQRTVPYPMLTTFDAPDSNVACTRRECSNTPLQALTLMNDPVFFECAQALGRRLTAEPVADPGERIQRAFEICLSRKPTAAESARLKTSYAEHLRLFRSNLENARKVVGDPLVSFSAAPAGERGTGASRADDAGPSPVDVVAQPAVAETATLVALARTILNLDEFVTRE